MGVSELFKTNENHYKEVRIILMSNWKTLKKSITLRLALALGLVIANLVAVAPAFAADASIGSAQVLSKRNLITPLTSVYNKLDPKDVVVTVTTDTELSAMKIINGKDVLTENDYTLVGNKVTILATYLNGLTKSAKLKFIFANGTNKILAITLKNESAIISSKSVSFTNKSTKPVSVTVKANGLMLQGISYDGADLPEDAYVEGAPSSSGSVKISIKELYLSTLADNETRKLTFDYSGTGTDPSITLKISGSKALTISSFRAVNQTTTAGVYPLLPEQVTANYTDSTSKLVDVTWDTIDASEYAEAGKTFYVTGTVIGTAEKAYAIVTVIAATDSAETTATKLVEKAEASKIQADKDAALVAVNALPLGAVRSALLIRVNAIVVVPAETEFEIIDVF